MPQLLNVIAGGTSAGQETSAPVEAAPTWNPADNVSEIDIPEIDIPEIDIPSFDFGGFR